MLNDYDTHKDFFYWCRAGEQPLEDRATCCLAELVLPKIESAAELWLCTQFLYRICKHSLLLRAPGVPETEDVVHRTMRMGISVSGYLMAEPHKRDWLAANYLALREFDARYSDQFDIPRSIKLTTVKPAGTTGLITGVTPGLHPGFARFYIRRVRMSADSPVAKWCCDRKFRYEFEEMADGTLNYSTIVVSFPCALPGTTVLVDDITAIDQLEFMRTLQRDWSDNAISVSIQYRVEEMDEIRRWLEANYSDRVKSVSFIQYSGHGFKQAPFEAIGHTEYLRLVDDLVWPAARTTVRAPQPVDDEDLLQGLECARGGCPLR